MTLTSPGKCQSETGCWFLLDLTDLCYIRYLEFEEFCQLSAKFLIDEDEEGMKKELKEAFRIYDKAGNGYIPTSALKEILHELEPKLTDQELEGIIEEIDKDGSGTVDFDGKNDSWKKANKNISFAEFMEMMTG